MIQKQYILFAMIILLANLTTPCSAESLYGAYDGDTLVFDDNGKLKLYHIFGLDTPETGQPYAEEATIALLDVLNNNAFKYYKKTVDGTLYEYIDVYYIDNKSKIETNIACYMIMNGYGYYDRSINVKNKRNDMFINSEKYASGIKRRVWSQNDFIYPWDFRKKQSVIEEEQVYINIVVGAAMPTGSIDIGQSKDDCPEGRGSLAQYICDRRRQRSIEAVKAEARSVARADNCVTKNMDALGLYPGMSGYENRYVQVLNICSQTSNAIDTQNELQKINRKINRVNNQQLIQKLNRQAGLPW